MDNSKQIQNHSVLSKLERFNLYFEFDKSIQEVKQEVKARTIAK